MISHPQNNYLVCIKTFRAHSNRQGQHWYVLLAWSIRTIINLSISTRDVPRCFNNCSCYTIPKNTLVKNFLLDRNELSIFRPACKVYCVLSTPQLLLCGVPQGSVLGLPLFTFYGFWSEASHLCSWHTNLHFFCCRTYNTVDNCCTTLYAGNSGLAEPKHTET